MESIIGYYYEPLSQAERDMMYEHFQEEMDKNFTVSLASRIVRDMHDAQRNDSFLNGSTEAYLEILNQHMVKALSNLADEYPGLPELKNESVTFYIHGEVKLSAKMTPWLQSVYRNELVLKSQHDPYRDNIHRLVYDYNEYLSKNPDVRKVVATPMGQAVERANRAILEKMEYHCYETQTSNKVFDFSSIILTAIKEAK